MGLVHRLCKPDALLTEARDYVSDLITRVSPESLRQSKRQVWLDWHRDVGASVREAGELLNSMTGQDDYKEAIKAFTEKRSANWGNRG